MIGRVGGRGCRRRRRIEREREGGRESERDREVEQGKGSKDCVGRAQACLPLPSPGQPELL